MLIRRTQGFLTASDLPRRFVLQTQVGLDDVCFEAAGGIQLADQCGNALRRKLRCQVRVGRLERDGGIAQAQAAVFIQRHHDECFKGHFAAGRAEYGHIPCSGTTCGRLTRNHFAHGDTVSDVEGDLPGILHTECGVQILLQQLADKLVARLQA